MTSSGEAVNDVVTLSFTLYDDQNNQIWREVISDVSITESMFSVYLGRLDNTLRDHLYTGTGRVLGITVNENYAQEMRQALGTVPYSFLSENSLKLGGYLPNYFATSESVDDIRTTLQTTIDNLISEDRIIELIEQFLSPRKDYS